MRLHGDFHTLILFIFRSRFCQRHMRRVSWLTFLAAGLSGAVVAAPAIIRLVKGDGRTWEDVDDVLLVASASLLTAVTRYLIQLVLIIREWKQRRDEAAIDEP